MIYLDNNATTSVDPSIVNAMRPYFDTFFGNPSSIHAFGQSVHQKIQEVRSLIAQTLSCSTQEIFFTSSGTAANNYCLKGFANAYQHKGKHLITSKIEHASVLETFAFLERQGFTVTYLNVDEEGLINPEDLRKQLRDDTILISISHVNNEIGTIQPLQELLNIAENIPFHTDAVQSYLKTDFNFQKYPVSLASFSGHKFHAPKGIGFIYIKNNIDLQTQLHGGYQERGLFSGTENVPFIIGLGEAIQHYRSGYNEQMKKLQKYLINEISDRFRVKINGPKDLSKRVCTNVNISFEGQEGDTLLQLFSEKNIYVSTGSACSSKNSRVSHVLKAINSPPNYIHGNIRIGLSRYTTKQDIQKFLKSTQDIISNHTFFSVNTLPLNSEQEIVRS